MEKVSCYWYVRGECGRNYSEGIKHDCKYKRNKEECHYFSEREDKHWLRGETYERESNNNS